MATSSQAQGLSKYVTLVSSDDFEFVVLREAACISGAIKRMLDPASETNSISPCSIHICVVVLTSNVLQANSRNRSMAGASLKKLSARLSFTLSCTSFSCFTSVFKDTTYVYNSCNTANNFGGIVNDYTIKTVRWQTPLVRGQGQWTLNEAYIHLIWDFSPTLCLGFLIMNFCQVLVTNISI